MHPNARYEWWYYTGHLRDWADHTYGFEVTAFKYSGLRRNLVVSPVDTAYRIDVAITDEDHRSFYSAVNYLLPSPNRTVLRTDRLYVRMLGTTGSAAIDTLPLSGFAYWVRARMQAGALDLTVQTTRRPLLEGGAGIVPMGTGGYSYYYSLTNMHTSGTLTLHGRHLHVSGVTWMDHQWGTWQWQKIHGWDWMGVQLSNGTSFALARFKGVDIPTINATTISFPDGTQRLTLGSSDVPLGPRWRSPITGVTYPQGWHIRVPGIGLDAVVLPTVAAQEVVDPTRLGPTYWEGSGRLRGTLRGKPITGLTYTELVGYGKKSVLGL